ncbi:MAG: hypothetical protein ACOYL5_19005 [Phototrophicaceae bacterium]
MNWLIGPIPLWAQLKHPILNYQLRDITRTPRLRLALRLILVVLIALALGAGSYLVASQNGRESIGQPNSEWVNTVVFFPLLGLQMFVSVVALAFTIGVVNGQEQRQTWDTLRASGNGVAIILRAAWASVFYRLREWLAILLAVRLILVGLVLFDLTSFEGTYLDWLTGGIVPLIPQTWAGIPLATLVGSLLVTLHLVALLVLPFTAVGFEAALGLWLSTWFRQRIYSVIVFMILLLAQVALILFLYGQFSAIALQGLTVGEIPYTAPQAWGVLFGFFALADWGVKFSFLTFAGEMWALIPYSILIGPALLIFAILQGAAADGLLRLAVRRAERHG